MIHTTLNKIVAQAPKLKSPVSAIDTTNLQNLIQESKILLSDGSSFFIRKQQDPINAKTEQDLPPLVHKPVGTQRIYLSIPEQKQLQSLRQDPEKRWSVISLSRKFNCTTEAVEAYSSVSEERKSEEKRAYDKKFDGLTWYES